MGSLRAANIAPELACVLAAYIQIYIPPSNTDKYVFQLDKAIQFDFPVVLGGAAATRKTNVAQYRLESRMILFFVGDE